MRKVKKKKKERKGRLAMATVPKRGGGGGGGGDFFPSVAVAAVALSMIVGAASSEQTFYGQGASASSSFSASPPGSSTTTSSASSPTRTVYREAGQNASLACGGVNANTLVRRLEWLCRGCRSASPSHETTIASFKADEGDNSTVAISEGLADRITVPLGVFGMSIDPVTAGDSGDYLCLVNNRRRPNAVVRLLVQDVPDPPGRPLIMAFTSRSVNLSWTPPLSTHNSLVSHYLIHVREGEDGTWDGDSSILETEANATVYRVSDLQPFTTYSFRVTAVNGMGRSSHSKESYYMLTLREVPSGKPTITAAHNTSSTSIRLSWRAPHPSTIHGEFLGYRIAFRPRDGEGAELKEIRIKDQTTERFIIQRLQIFTQYLVSVQVFNPEGLGPATTVVVMTDEGVPSGPVNVSFREVTNSSVVVHWQEPNFPNGLIQGYRLYYMHKNYTEVVTVREPAEEMGYLLVGLEPFTKYKLWLKAFTWKNEGDPSKPFELVTDVDGPSAPIITNLTCHDEHSIFLEWERPGTVFKSLDSYYVLFRSADRWEEFEEVSVDRNGTEEATSEILLSNLTTNLWHELKVQGATRSIYNQSLVYRGDFSESQKILLRLNCDEVHASTVVRTEDIGLELSAGMIAGGACVGFALILAVLAVALWRKYFNESYYYLDESPATPAPSIVPDWDIERPSSTTTSLGSGNTGSSTSFTKSAIPAHLFIRHVTSLHADGDIGFSKEYEAIQAMSPQENFAADLSNLEDNKAKNRYHNVVAYDHSRVQLRPLPGQKRGEYVNANYIDGFQKARAYIGTQGPLPSTFDSFWRMIWEQRVKTVVMITNLVERGRRKCDLYWPTQGTQTYGLIEVALTDEEVLATYTVRTFKIRHTKIKSSKHKSVERAVYQYHYTNWPDHGVPENPLPVLSFVKKSSANNKDQDGPIIVHCSAGVGRTGAHILIDSMLKQMRAKGELNLVAYLKHIRTQRNYLVQTEEQYIFVHDALAEAVASGETNINRSYLSRYINSLQTSFTTDENSIPWQLLDRQFKLASAYRPQESQFVAALKPFNQSKNQNFDFLPIESARVSLVPKPGVEGSDYINASWLPGFNKLKEYIITQHPTDQTVPDFWQMLWDHNARTVVVLSALQQPEFGIFWPRHQRDIDLDSIRVKLVEESEMGGYQTKDFSLISLHDDYELTVKLIFCPSWPHHCSPLATCTDLIRTLRGRNNVGPLVVVDRYGGTEAATFCALATLLRQLDFESHVDVYQYAKVSHNRRPGIWKIQDDYLYLYRVIEAVCFELEKKQKGDSGAPSTSPTRTVVIKQQQSQSRTRPYTNGHCNGNGLPSFTTVRIPPDGSEATALPPAASHQHQHV